MSKPEIVMYGTKPASGIDPVEVREGTCPITLGHAAYREVNPEIAKVIARRRKARQGAKAKPASKDTTK